MEVLHSGIWWRTPGTKTLQFEEEYAAYHQVPHGVACTNGTAALKIALAALDCVSRPRHRARRRGLRARQRQGCPVRH